MAIRYDRAKLSKTSKTPQGFLRAPAAFTKTGIFEYQRADGSKIRELRSEAEVFNPLALDSMASMPLTRDHPGEGMITPKNVKQHQIGFTGDTVRKDGDKPVGTVTVTDQDAIADVECGKLCELSMGYNCDVDKTPGVDPVHGPYDQIQKNIVYNHVAIGGVGWGRAGADVGLRLDAEGAVLVTPLDIGSEIAVHTDSTETMEVHVDKIVIAGITFEVSPQVAEAVKAERATQKRTDSDVAKVIAEHEALQGRFDAQAVELAKVKTDLVKAEDPARLDSKVADRLALVEKARKVLGPEAEIKGTDREIMGAALRKDSAGLDLTGKSLDYVQARFDAIVDNAPAASLAAARAGSTFPEGQTQVRADSKAAREKMIADNAKAWQQPLAVTNKV